nr:probable serine/threonine-protein kinase nek3 isoform X2 [Procambarus clarkii]
MSLTEDLSDLLDDDDDQKAVPADEFYSVLDELTEDIAQGRRNKYSSIIKKYICLAHGLPSPDIYTEDSDMKKRRKSLLKFIKQHKPDYSTSGRCITASKKLECRTPASKKLKSCTPPSKSGDVDLTMEVQETLKMCIKELGLSEDYQATELVGDIWDGESHLLDNQSGQNETTCSIIITNDDETKNDSQQFQTGKASRDAPERRRKVVNEHRTINGNNDQLKNNVEDTVQPERKITDKFKTVNGNNNQLKNKVEDNVRPKRKITDKSKTVNGNNNQLKNNVEDNVRPKRKITDKSKTVNGNNNQLTNNIEVTVQSKRKTIGKSTATKKACSNVELPVPAKNQVNNEASACTIVLTEALDLLFIPPGAHKQTLKSEMESNNYFPMYSISVCKNATNNTSQPTESSESDVTQPTSEGEPKILLKVKKRNNSCHDNRNTRKKTKMEDKQKNVEYKEVQPEEMSAKNPAQCMLPEKTDLLPKNEAINETAKKRGRAEKNSSAGENNLPVFDVNEVSPELQTLHSPLEQVYTLPEKDVPVISPCKMRGMPKATISNLETQQSQVDGKQILPENNVSKRSSRRRSLKENDSTAKPSLEVLFVAEATHVKDISDVSNMQNVSVKKISPKQMSSHLPPKAVCNISKGEITKEITGKRRETSHKKSRNKETLQDVPLEKVSHPGKGQEIMSSNDIVALSPSKNVSHLQEENIAPESMLNEGYKHSSACKEGTLVALPESVQVASNEGTLVALPESVQVASNEGTLVALPESVQVASNEGTLVALPESVQVASNEGHGLIESVSSEECQDKETTVVKVSEKSKTDAACISSTEQTSCKKSKGKLVLNRKLSESKQRFVFRYFSEEEEKKKQKRFNFLEENSDNEIKEVSKGESMCTTEHKRSTIVGPKETSYNVGIKQDLCKKPCTTVLSNTDLKRKLNSQRWHKRQEEDIIAGINIVTRKRKIVSSRHSKAIDYSKISGNAGHMESQLMFQKGTFQELSTIIADATGPVLPPLRADSPDILIIPCNNIVDIPKIQNDFSLKEKEVFLPQYGLKTMEGESLTCNKTTRNKNLHVRTPVNTNTCNSKTHINVKVAEDRLKKNPPSSYYVDNSGSDEELNLLNVEHTSLAPGSQLSSLRATISTWETFHDSQLQSIQVESCQSSQQKVETQKTVQSFFDVDKSDEMQTYRQTSVLGDTSKTGDSKHSKHSSSSSSQSSRTSCVPNYSILGGERWLAAVKSMKARKKPLVLMVSHHSQKVSRNKKKQTRS